MSDDIVALVRASGRRIQMPVCARCGKRMACVRMRRVDNWLTATVKCHGAIESVKIDLTDGVTDFDFGTAFTEQLPEPPKQIG
jgi:hypothetical protein